jgi:hypothetical protein
MASELSHWVAVLFQVRGERVAMGQVDGSKLLAGLPQS